MKRSYLHICSIWIGLFELIHCHKDYLRELMKTAYENSL